jgi:cell wall-associated NlpC family hydrolase
VFGQHGLRIPRTVGEQYRAGNPIDPGSVAPGDLLFFDTNGAGATHVGIAIGGDEFVHAPSGRGEVRVERLRVNYWKERFVGARRLN